jgi:hypothetical protein
VNCGQEWDANVDRSSKLRTYFAQPVKGRYIRLYPQEWHGWISMRMAALICEKPCVENRLDYALEGTYASRSDGPALMPAWGEGIFHGLDGYSFRAGAGFEIDASRCFKPMPLKGWSVVLNVKLAVTSGGPKALKCGNWFQGVATHNTPPRDGKLHDCSLQAACPSFAPARSWSVSCAGDMASAAGSNVCPASIARSSKPPWCRRTAPEVDADR